MIFGASKTSESKAKEVLKTVLKKIRVSSEEQEELLTYASEVVSRLKQAGLTAKIGGSLAKNTLVKKDVQDVDVFVVFDDEKALSKFAKKIESIDFDGAELKHVHGSRDYIQVLFSNFTVELIPVLSIKKPEEAMNVTDVSLFHVDFVTSEIKKHKKISEEIILAKSFCRAQGFYGAESYIRGFSGYSLEVLVAHFGSFTEFLKGLVKLNKSKNRVIDPKKYFNGEKDVLYQMNAAKLVSPIIVVDPTYKYRNVTAGLGSETYESFLKVADEFLKNPSEEFFEKKKVSESELLKIADKENATLFLCKMTTDKQEGDIAGAKCLKFFDFFTEELKRNSQEIILKKFLYNGKGSDATGYVIVKESLTTTIKGPPARMEKAAKAFQKEHKNAYTKKGILYVDKPVSTLEIFDKCNRVSEEMGASGTSIEVVVEPIVQDRRLE